MTDTEWLTPAEAAVVADVSVRDINRVIDEQILPERFYTVEGGRRLASAACPLVGFYFRSATALTADERGRLIQQITSSPNYAHSSVGRWTIRDGFLTVRLWEFASSAKKRQTELAEARAMVVEDPDILSGIPVIGGTRIPVYDIAASMAKGISRERLRSAYPQLTDRVFELAVIYAEATPVRGRPKRSDMLAPHVDNVVMRKVVKRQRA